MVVVLLNTKALFRSSVNYHLLNSVSGTPSFSLKDLDSSSTLWFMRVITIFLLYFKWSFISLLNSDFLAWLSSLFFFYSMDIYLSSFAFCLTDSSDVNFLLTFSTFLTVFSSLCFMKLILAWTAWIIYFSTLMAFSVSWFLSFNYLRLICSNVSLSLGYCCTF